MRQFRYLHSDTEGMEKFETLYICKKNQNLLEIELNISNQVENKIMYSD